MTQDIYLIRIITCILFLKCNILFSTKMQQNSINILPQYFKSQKIQTKQILSMSGIAIFSHHPGLHGCGNDMVHNNKNFTGDHQPSPNTINKWYTESQVPVGLSILTDISLRKISHNRLHVDCDIVQCFCYFSLHLLCADWLKIYTLEIVNCLSGIS